MGAGLRLPLGKLRDVVAAEAPAGDHKPPRLDLDARVLLEDSEHALDVSAWIRHGVTEIRRARETALRHDHDDLRVALLSDALRQLLVRTVLRRVDIPHGPALEPVAGAETSVEVQPHLHVAVLLECRGHKHDSTVAALLL